MGVVHRQEGRELEKPLESTLEEIDSKAGSDLVRVSELRFRSLEDRLVLLSVNDG